MGMRIFPHATLLLLAGTCFAVNFSFAQINKPNVIYIMTDDLGYGDLGVHGQKQFSTPNIDKLAAEGIRFTNAYAAHSLCTPTRAAFMTGRYPARTTVGLIEPLTGSPKDSAYGLSKNDPSIASIMKANGYTTMLVGKWHLGFKKEFSPNENGFDYFFGFHSGAIDYISHVENGNKPDLFENDSLIEVNGYMTDMLASKAASLISKKHTAPFFLVLNFNAPHWPWQAPTSRPYQDTMDFRVGGSKEIYMEMMRSLDNAIGTVMQALEQSGLAKETLVIFTNDNGGERFSNNGVFSNSKGSLWEGGIRVPAFVRWPGKIKPGTSTSQMAITMDWSATILAAAGASIPGSATLDGIDLLPICKGERDQVERTFFWRTFQRKDQQAIRQGRWKYLKVEADEYLFDIINDPSEKYDQKNKQQQVLQEMKATYASWQSSVLKPIPLEPAPLIK